MSVHTRETAWLRVSIGDALWVPVFGVLERPQFEPSVALGYLKAAEHRERGGMVSLRWRPRAVSVPRGTM